MTEAPDEQRHAPVPLTLVDADTLDVRLGALPHEAAAWARACGFSGELGQSVALPRPDGSVERILVGWGTARKRARGRFHLGRFARTAPAGTYRLDMDLSVAEAEEAALGWRLGRYRFDRYKSRRPRQPASLETPAGVDAGRLGAVADGVFLCRDLVNTPASDMGPAALEAAIRDLGARHGAEVSAVIGDDLLVGNLPLIHTVGRSAAEAPRLVELVWGREDDPAVTLVGKGVCFDTGGLNLKPGSSMALMKKDMGGAATMIALAHMIMALRLRIRLRLLVPAVENAVAGGSFRPGDVLTSRKGLTVEVNNTDAEGRLVLADALALAAEDAPALLIDAATLTGAARVALGPDVPPFFTDDEDLAQALSEAAARVSDPLWRLPLWPGYEADIEPDIADLDNAPKGGMAGAITAALFLKRFTDGLPWVHFDVFAWCPATRPGCPKGGECQAARAMLAVLEDRYG